MKKRTKIILGVILTIVAALLISAVTLVCMNWEIAKGVFSLLKSAPGNNLKAAWIFLTENSEGIETRLNDNQEKYGEAVSSVLSELNEQGTGISKEAVDALNSGLYTEEEMIRIITSGGAELEEINRSKELQQQQQQSENGGVPDEKENLSTESGNQTQNPSGSGSGSDTDKTENTNTNTNTNTNVSETGSSNNNSNNSDGGKNQTNPPPASKDNNNDNKNSTDTNGESTAQSGQNETPKSVTPSQPQPTQPDDTAASVAKLYIIKSNFVSQLSSIEKQITSAYVALPKEQQTPASRKSIAGEYISTVASLELDCDSQVEAILSELKTKLEAASKDTSVVETIRQSYENEKSLKKAYYMDIYMNGLPKKTTTEK